MSLIKSIKKVTFGQYLPSSPCHTWCTVITANLKSVSYELTTLTLRKGTVMSILCMEYIFCFYSVIYTSSSKDTSNLYAQSLKSFRVEKMGEGVDFRSQNFFSVSIRAGHNFRCHLFF
jgi:hypothetical protein